MAVDLRSERVRAAAYLLDGVRRGGELGDLLGCRFERRLHDLLLDRFIDDCRRRVLEAKGITRAPRGPVDGLELAELHHGPGVRSTCPTRWRSRCGHDKEETAPGRVGLQGALNGLLASMDAVADASLADSMHYLLQGNSDARLGDPRRHRHRCRAAARASAGWKLPVTGASVTHRLIVALGAGPRARPEAGARRRARSSSRRLRPGWRACSATPRRSVAWCGSAATGEQVPVSLADLADSQGFSPLDACSRVSGIWERRARAHFLSRPAHAKLEDDLAGRHRPRRSGRRGSCRSTTSPSLHRRFARSLRRRRPLDARDLALPGAELESGADQAEAGARRGRVSSRPDERPRTPRALLPRPSEDVPAPVGKTSLASIRAALLGAGRPRDRGRRARSRLCRGGPGGAPRAGLGGARRRLGHASRRRGPLEPGFPLLPRFAADSAATSKSILDRSDELTRGGLRRGDGLAARRGARARRAPARSTTRSRWPSCCTTRRASSPVVGQLPAAPGEPWVALHAPGDRRRGELSLVRHRRTAGARGWRRAGMAAGLVVDEWAEVLPADEAVTGVALNYDAPASRPPQAMLLALPPEGSQLDLRQRRRHAAGGLRGREAAGGGPRHPGRIRPSGAGDLPAGGRSTRGRRRRPMADDIWDRIEPHTRDPRLEEGLQARLADTLWMLARQWQVGEFRGEDAASPIHVRCDREPLRSSRASVTTRRREPRSSGSRRAGRSSRGSRPRPGRGTARVALAGEVGLQLLRRLDGARLQRLRAPFRARVPLPPRAGGPPRPARARERRLRLLARGSHGRPERARGAAGRERGDRPGRRSCGGARRAGRRRGRSSAALRPAGRIGRDLGRQPARAPFSIAAPGPEARYAELDRVSRRPGSTGTRSTAAAYAPRRALQGPAGNPGARWTCFRCRSPTRACRRRATGRWRRAPSTSAGSRPVRRTSPASPWPSSRSSTPTTSSSFPVRFPAGSIARVTRLVVRNTFERELRGELQRRAGTSRRRGADEHLGVLRAERRPVARRGQPPWLLLVPALPARRTARRSSR